MSGTSEAIRNLAEAVAMLAVATSNYIGIDAMHAIIDKAELAATLADPDFRPDQIIEGG